MELTSRRSLLTLGGVGTVAAGLGVLWKSSPEASAAAQHGHKPVSGPLSQATVSFGQWIGDQGLDRMDPAFNPITSNHHILAPYEVTIQAGGAVSYIVSGFHQIVVYDDGTQPGNIDTSNLVLSQGPGAPPFPILIDDPVNRIFRGADPGGQPLDRVESVHFSEPGTYLVICGVIFHFADDNMYGFVKVLP